MDPAETSLGIPHRELDAAHPSLDTHLVPWVEPGDEVANPEDNMVELEQEHRDWESNLLAQISDLEDRAWSYGERLNKLASTNSNLHEALRNQESGVEARVNAIQR
jgi:hypothetical protein